jgi:hypothetical protein
MSYLIRDKNGILLLKIDDLAANQIIVDCAGHFRSWKTENREVSNVFEISEASCLTLLGIKIFLWEGTLLIPDVK